MSSLYEVKEFQKREQAKRAAVRKLQKEEERKDLRAQQRTRKLLFNAVEALLLAYARNDDGAASIDWGDLDDAFILAKRALPGRYRALVKQIKKEEQK